MHGNATHGMSKTRIFRIWLSMINRCHCVGASGYYKYGARGIVVCDRWRDSFVNFLSDMGEPPAGMSIERKDNDGNYDSANCIWATRLVQANNTRANRFLDHDGKRLTTAQWALVTDIPTRTIEKRLKLGWPVAKALTTPIRRAAIRGIRFDPKRNRWVVFYRGKFYGRFVDRGEALAARRAAEVQG